jgi:hypothetical protein
LALQVPQAMELKTKPYFKKIKHIKTNKKHHGQTPSKQTIIRTPTMGEASYLTTTVRYVGFGLD